ncbi:MAG: DinB family protein [Anaerolineales bacterium]|nr:DinB family protein [Anaerolineales bacterium]
MIEDNKSLLEKYLKLPDRLEAAVAGLSESDLDLKQGDGWTIRQYVHHLVEGENLWQVNLRAVVGTDGIAFPFTWYFALPQDEWAKRWAYDKRPLGPSLALFRANTWNLVETLRNIPDVWEHFGRVTWRGAEKETCITVRQIVEMHLGHMDGHVEDIQAIRVLYQR